MLVHAVAQRVTDSAIAGKEFDLDSFEGTTLWIDAETMIVSSKIVGGKIIVDNGVVRDRPSPGAMIMRRGLTVGMYLALMI